MPIIPAMRKVERGGLLTKVGAGKVNGRLYLKNKLKAKGLGAWLMWLSNCFAIGRP
jgi:hypothetical protein